MLGLVGKRLDRDADIVGALAASQFVEAEGRTLLASIKSRLQSQLGAKRQLGRSDVGADQAGPQGIGDCVKRRPGDDGFTSCYVGSNPLLERT